MSNEMNPYASPKAGREFEGDTLRATTWLWLRWPAGLMIGGGVIMLAVLALNVVSDALLLALGRHPNWESRWQWWTSYWWIMALWNLGAAIGIYGGIQMLRMRQYRMCLASAIVVSIPCTAPCFFTMIPVGIFAVVLLLRKDTRAAFAEGK